MRIGIDATCWANPRGYGRYTRGLLGALFAQSTPHDFTLFVDSHTASNDTWPVPQNIATVEVPTTVAPTQAASASGRRSLSDMWHMSAAVMRSPIDVIFYPSVYTYFPVLSKATTLLGIHDVIAEQYASLVFPDRQQRWAWSAKNWLGRQQADYIVTVSEYAKQGIASYFGWPMERLWVVGEAPDSVFRPLTGRPQVSRILAKYGLTDTSRYIICLGGLNPHKNLDLLLVCLARLRSERQFSDVCLVLVGPAEDDNFTPGFTTLRKKVSELALDDAIYLTGYIPDEEVVCLLNGALLLAMPSFDEGYGLGAVEAAACGTPVIATRNSPLPDLLRGGGLFIDPTQPNELLSALRELIGNNSQRQSMSRVALERARQLTWPWAARQFLSLLDLIAEDGS